MIYLLDTCLISEWIKPQPNSGVMKWTESIPEKNFCISVITFGEIAKGIEQSQVLTKRNYLTLWMSELEERFSDKILPISLLAAKKWGEISQREKSKGRILGAGDGLIAATALTHNLKIVTRNEKDFDHSGLSVVNPWS